MPDEAGPMVRRRQLGTALRQYRQGAGLSVTEAASRLLVAPSKISRIENAQRNASVRDVRDLCEVYGIDDGAVRNQLMELARESRKRAWWQDMNLPPFLQTILGIEASARRIREFETLVLPGFLQTRAYAEAIAPPLFHADLAQRDAIINARMRRREIFVQDAPPQVEVILDEPVLRRAVGGRAVMKDQLNCLIEMAGEVPSLTVRVMQFDMGVHAGMAGGGFTIFEYALPDLPVMTESLQSVAYVETLTEVKIHDDDRVLTYGEVFGAISRQALNEHDSLEFIRTLWRTM